MIRRFNRTGYHKVPTLNTASLPDIIFILLFFFMIVANMHEVKLKIEFKVPYATELKRLEKKSLVTHIYVGKPTEELQKKMGTESRIQLNDRFVDISEIQDYITQERANLTEEERSLMTISLDIDRDTQMGIVTDIKQALRKAGALNIYYSAQSLE